MSRMINQRFDNYEDTYRYIADRTIESVNVNTPADKAAQNLRSLQYMAAHKGREIREHKQLKVTVKNGLLNMALVIAVFGAFAGLIFLLTSI